MVTAYQARFGFPPGDSPFHVRGYAYRFERDFLEENARGGFDGVLSGIHEEALRIFLDQPFLDTQWYDVFPAVALSKAAGSALGCTIEDYVASQADYAAKRALEGMFSFVLRLPTTREVAERLPQLIAKGYDFIRALTEWERPGQMYLGYTGLPAAFSEHFTIHSEHFVRSALELAGALAPRLEEVTIDPAGSAHGMPIHRISGRICWRED